MHIFRTLPTAIACLGTCVVPFLLSPFKKFGVIDPQHTGAWLDEVVGRAADQNEQYLELMITPTWNRLDTSTEGMSWSEDFNALREELLAKGLTQDVPAARAFFDQAEAEHRKRSNCGQPDAAPACKVATRYIYEVFRSTPKELVFAQALFGFELASADPRVGKCERVRPSTATSMPRFPRLRAKSRAGRQGELS